MGKRIRLISLAIVVVFLLRGRIGNKTFALFRSSSIPTFIWEKFKCSTTVLGLIPLAFIPVVYTMFDDLKKSKKEMR